jgi:hypothetical protein
VVLRSEPEVWDGPSARVSCMTLPVSWYEPASVFYVWTTRDLLVQAYVRSLLTRQIPVHGGRSWQ